MDETALDCRVRIDFPYCREDARSAIDHEGFYAVPKRIPEDSQVTDDFFLPLFPADAEPYGFPDFVRAVREQHFPSRKRVSVNHETSDAFEELVDVADDIPVQAALGVGAYEVFGLSRLIGYLPNGIAFGNVFPEPRVRSEQLLCTLDVTFDETTVAVLAFQPWVSEVVPAVFPKVATLASGAFFFAF